MNDLSKLQLLVALIVIVVSVGGADVRAQSRDDAQKRVFKERLSRQAHRSAIESARSAEVAHAARRKVEARQPVRSAVDVSFVASRVTGPNLGVSAATPVVPSGHGVGRDAFVESLFTQILGFDPSESDLDFWTLKLARGENPERVARALWDSKEHQMLIRRHKVPDIPFNRAYHDAHKAALRGKDDR